MNLDDSNDDRIPALREQYRDVLRLAIETRRPASETWPIATHEPHDGTVLMFHLVRGTEVSRRLPIFPKATTRPVRPLQDSVSVFAGMLGGGVNPSRLPRLNPII
jgi:hypothetical protein